MVSQILYYFLQASNSARLCRDQLWWDPYEVAWEHALWKAGKWMVPSGKITLLQDGPPVNCRVQLPKKSGWILWFMVDITVVNGDYKSTYSWGAPSCMENHNFNRSTIYKWVIFHSHVSLPEQTMLQFRGTSMGALISWLMCNTCTIIHAYLHDLTCISTYLNTSFVGGTTHHRPVINPCQTISFQGQSPMLRWCPPHPQNCTGRYHDFWPPTPPWPINLVVINPGLTWYGSGDACSDEEN